MEDNGIISVVYTHNCEVPGSGIVFSGIYETIAFY